MPMQKMPMSANAEDEDAYVCQYRKFLFSAKSNETMLMLMRFLMQTVTMSADAVAN